MAQNQAHNGTSRAARSLSDENAAVITSTGERERSGPVYYSPDSLSLQSYSSFDEGM